jgi:hypothetical protein
MAAGAFLIGREGMKHVFIAVGGSGSKVAEALVRLLAVGFPTRKENGVLTSAGDTLQIWRIDPDRSSGAAVALQKAVKDYAGMQAHLQNGEVSGGGTGSRWALAIDPKVRQLDPLQLPKANPTDNELKTLQGILDSGYALKSSKQILSSFYEPKDLTVEIDRGFYQKPFIGAAVMAVFAESLRNDNSPGGRECNLTAFHNNRANFFLCGSLHGGTGACGVPVMGRFLASRKNANPGWGWRVGACLLAPYCVPPQPPFDALREGETISEQERESLLRAHTDDPAFAGLTDEQKRKLVQQILDGFFADPEAMEARARQGLSYYKDHSADYFDELYLVGKPEPDKLKVWSNGGSSQNNPLNSAEVVAAFSALNFFANANTGNPQSYVIGSTPGNINSEQMNLGQLPSYTVDNENVDAERVFLTTAVLIHLLRHQIPWNKRAREWGKEIAGLRRLYEKSEVKKDEDRAHFESAANTITTFLMSTLDPNIAKGWSGEDASRLWTFLSNDAAVVSDVSGRMAKKFFGDEPKGTLELGDMALKLTTFDFGKWCPDGDQFSRGQYLRHVWSHIYDKCTNKT